MPMQYEWDKVKAFSNQVKHQVNFSDAVIALEDEFALTMEDGSAEGEHRFITLGMNDIDNLLTVVWAERVDDIVRIISARKATRHERKTYLNRRNQ